MDQESAFRLDTPAVKPTRSRRVPLMVVTVLAALVVGLVVAVNQRAPQVRAVRSEADTPGGLDAKTAAMIGWNGQDPRFELYAACLGREGFDIEGAIAAHTDDRPLELTQAQQAAIARANAECQDLRPASFRATDNYMKCLSENGIDTQVGLPAPPPEQRIDAAVARKALEVCKPRAPVEGPDAGYQPYLTCMNDNGVFPQLPVRQPQTDTEAAEKACASKQPKPPLLPELQVFVDCLATNGLTVDFARSSPQTFDPAVIKAAWATCKDVAPSFPQPDYANCLAENGVIIHLAKEGLIIPEDGSDPDVAKGRAALKACEALEPAAEDQNVVAAPISARTVAAPGPMAATTVPRPTP